MPTDFEYSNPDPADCSVLWGIPHQDATRVLLHDWGVNESTSVEALDDWYDKAHPSKTLTIVLEIRPEVQVELARQASALDRPLEAHAALVLEEALQLPVEVPKTGFGKRLVEVCAMVSGLTDDLDLTRSPSTWRPLELA